MPSESPTPHDPWLTETLPAPRRHSSIPIAVYRIGSEGEREAMPNIQCLAVNQRIGTDPGRATFRYNFALGVGDDAYPPNSESALDAGSSYDKTVEIDDRLQVWATRPDGVEEAVFDGRALDFEMQLEGNHDEVRIHAVGVAKDAWNKVIPGQIVRGASDPSDTEEQAATDLPVRFNPEGLPNATAEGQDMDAGGEQLCPAFLDPAVSTTKWTLNTAAAYLIFTSNPEQDVVKNPTRTDLDNLYVQRRPIAGVRFDPDDAATYTAEPIVVGDAPRSGRDWPTELAAMTRDHGFTMTWRLTTDAEEDPPVAKTTLYPFLLQSGELKDVWLQPRGSNLDLNLCNINVANVGRRTSQVVNAWEVQGGLIQYEASFVLAPGFPCATADAASAAAVNAFDKSAAGFDDVRNQYRLYIMDESGEGHYYVGHDLPDNEVPYMSFLTGASVRRRKPLPALVTKAADGSTRRPMLHISTNYDSDHKPGMWNGAGDWQPVFGGWELLKDRIGIRVTANNPNEWKIGESTVSTHPFRRGVVKGVEQQAASGATRFDLMLTCVVEGDRFLSALADRQDTSPIASTIRRVIDAKDRYKKQVVVQHSWFNRTAFDVVARNDEAPARAEAETARSASEAGVLDGTVVIPRFTLKYQLGDRIKQINGRGLSFRTDKADDEIRTPIYPSVVGITYDLAPVQRTTLELSDEAAERHMVSRKINRDAPRPGKHDL